MFYVTERKQLPEQCSLLIPGCSGYRNTVTDQTVFLYNRRHHSMVLLPAAFRMEYPVFAGFLRPIFVYVYQRASFWMHWCNR